MTSSLQRIHKKSICEINSNNFIFSWVFNNNTLRWFHSTLSSSPHCLIYLVVTPVTVQYFVVFSSFLLIIPCQINFSSNMKSNDPYTTSSTRGSCMSLMIKVDRCCHGYWCGIIAVLVTSLSLLASTSHSNVTLHDGNLKNWKNISKYTRSCPCGVSYEELTGGCIDYEFSKNCVYCRNVSVRCHSKSGLDCLGESNFTHWYTCLYCYQIPSCQTYQTNCTVTENTISLDESLHADINDENKMTSLLSHNESQSCDLAQMRKSAARYRISDTW